MSAPNHQLNIPIHVALAIWDLTDSYNRHASVTMVSLLEHTKSPIVFYLLYDERRSNVNPELAQRNKNRYDEIKRRYNTEIIYSHVAIPDWVKTLPFISVYTEASILRLFLPEILPHIEKIIYLDTDIVVQRDIAELWDINIEDYFVAAVRISKLPFVRIKKYQKKGIDTDHYFNSGVIVFNLKKIRLAMNLSDEALKCLRTNPDFGWPDQDVLNLLLLPHVLFLNKIWNYPAQSADIDNKYDVILHFAGGIKPWKSYSGEACKYYWKYLLNSPWSDNKMEFMDYILDAPNIDKTLERLPQWIMQHMPKQQISYLWLISIWNPLKVLMYDLRYLILYQMFGRNNI